MKFEDFIPALSLFTPLLLGGIGVYVKVCVDIAILKERVEYQRRVLSDLLKSQPE